MKNLQLNVIRHSKKSSFRVHRLGLHEGMKMGMINRPEGTGDYLFMLFHSPIRITGKRGEQSSPALSFIIWKPGDGHYYGNPSAPWDHSWFHCGGPAIGPMLKQNQVPVGEVITLKDPSILERYLVETAAEINNWSSPNEVILKNLFENFIQNLKRQAAPSGKPLVPIRLLAVRAQLEQSFSEEIYLSKIARETGCSVPHLCTEFKRYFGLPVMKYVHQLRMSQAAYFLRDHNRRIGEIALILGYADLYTFSKMFRRSFGVSPRKFRQEITT